MEWTEAQVRAILTDILGHHPENTQAIIGEAKANGYASFRNVYDELWLGHYPEKPETPFQIGAVYPR